MSRNRVITPTQALFISTNATGAQTISQLHRVQSANHGSSITRTPVTQFGKQAPIDNVILEPAAVSLDFSYLVTNAYNEAKLGFVTDGTAQAISGLLSKAEDEKNYYILTVPEGEEAVDGDTTAANNAVVGIGNGFISSYTFEAQVGQFPTASVNVEALNVVGYGSSAAQQVPSIQPTDGQRITGQNFTLPASDEGVASQASALRPGDLYMTLAQPTFGVDINDAKLQSLRIAVELAREPQNKLGSHFPFSRELSYPINVTVSAEANVGDILESGSLSDVLCNDADVNLTVGLRKPSCTGAGPVAIEYQVKGAKLDSQSFSASAGSNQTVSLQWTSQIGGPRDTVRGLFISGTQS